MPTERFYRLPEEKKQSIKRAAMKEFARVPYEKASINKMIQSAEISRGSFYTYFEDKKDVISYIFEEGGTKMAQRCKEILKENDGDCFRMLPKLFEHVVDQLQSTREMIEIARNVMPYQEGNQIFGVDREWKPFHINQIDDPYTELYGAIDRSQWRLQDEETLESLLELGFSSMMISFMQFYQHPEELEQIKKRYRRKIEILRYGISTSTKTE